MLTVEQIRYLEHETLRTHRSDNERGGCTCGFCVWNCEHVLAMFRIELENLLPKMTIGSTSAQSGKG